MKCGKCDAAAEFLIFAAYDVGYAPVHPLVSRYPAAMARTCGSHLAEHLTADAGHPGSTAQWIVKPA